MSVRRAAKAKDQTQTNKSRAARPASTASESNTAGSAKRNTANATRAKAAAQGTPPKVEIAKSREEENAKFTPRVDRRIIEGMLDDRETLFQEMRNVGLNEAAILRRAAELGLSEALLRQVKGVAADLAGERPGRRAPSTNLGARTCLCCDRIFLSTGPGNRLCMRCRGGDAGLAQI